ncbi:hypothetical protein ACGC1H_001680 [Rhizoctonia solani]|uniref:RING-type domain-containing protein n=1 Tax=Rhizoctonia solani TaxID=456999 RepID=A0A8H3B2K0_9AGAM|nr:unnamed protein product [Rhizoctonia solani]
MTAICSICQEKLQSGQAAVLSLCGHVLCDGCLQQWAGRNNPPNKVDCPMCRRRHLYPKQTHILYFEEEQSEAKIFRNEISNVIKLVERCAGDGSSVKGVVAELKKLSDKGKQLNDPSVTQATISGLDAMINHLSKKLAPLRSAEELEQSLADTISEMERIVNENKHLVIQRQELEAKLTAQRSETEARTQTIQVMMRESERARRMEAQMAKMKVEQEALKKDLKKVREEKENAREKILVLKRKNLNLMTTNESLRVDLNLSLSTRPPPSTYQSPSPTKRLSRGSIISIRSQSSPESKFVSLVSSDGEEHKVTESSSVQFISDDDDDEPVPAFRELKSKIKPVKPIALFQQVPQASTSRPPRSVQKRKLAASVPTTPNNGGLELRNGKLTGLVATGPKRSKRA